MFKISREQVSYSHSGPAQDISGPLSASRVSEGGGEAKGLEKSRLEAQALIRQAEERFRDICSQADSKAQSLRDEAIAEAGQIISEAKLEAEMIKQQAKIDGYKEGRLKAETRIGQLREKDAEAFEEAVAAVRAESEDFLKGLEPRLMELALDIAYKVTTVRIKEDESLLRAMIESGLKRLANTDKLRIKLCQEEFDRFFSEGRAVFSPGRERVSASVLARPDFKTGDCLIETEGEALNISLDQQFEVIKKAFSDASLTA